MPQPSADIRPTSQTMTYRLEISRLHPPPVNSLLCLCLRQVWLAAGYGELIRPDLEPSQFTNFSAPPQPGFRLGPNCWIRSELMLARILRTARLKPGWVRRETKTNKRLRFLENPRCSEPVHIQSNTGNCVHYSEQCTRS